MGGLSTTQLISSDFSDINLINPWREFIYEQPDPTENTYFSTVMAQDDDILAIGDGLNFVDIWRLAQGVWSFVNKITPEAYNIPRVPPVSKDPTFMNGFPIGFGSAIAVDGITNLIFIGYNQQNLNVTPNGGVVYIFEITPIGSNNIELFQTIEPPVFAQQDNGYFGSHLGVTDGVLCVVKRPDIPSFINGVIFFYLFNPMSNEFEFINSQSPTVVSPGTINGVGSKIADCFFAFGGTSNIYCAVGFPEVDDSGFTNTGFIYLFYYDGMIFQTCPSVIMSSSANNEFLGWSLAAKQNAFTFNHTLAYLNFNNPASSNLRGFTVEESGLCNFVQVNEFIASPGQATLPFGADVALDSDFNVAILNNDISTVYYYEFSLGALPLVPDFTETYPPVQTVMGTPVSRNVGVFQNFVTVPVGSESFEDLSNAGVTIIIGPLASNFPLVWNGSLSTKRGGEGLTFCEFHISSALNTCVGSSILTVDLPSSIPDINMTVAALLDEPEWQISTNRRVPVDLITTFLESEVVRFTDIDYDDSTKIITSLVENVPSNTTIHINAFFICDA